MKRWEEEEEEESNEMKENQNEMLHFHDRIIYFTLHIQQLRSINDTGGY